MTLAMDLSVTCLSMNFFLEFSLDQSGDFAYLLYGLNDINAKMTSWDDRMSSLLDWYWEILGWENPSLTVVMN